MGFRGNINRGGKVGLDSIDDKLLSCRYRFFFFFFLLDLFAYLLFEGSNDEIYNVFGFIVAPVAQSVDFKPEETEKKKTSAAHGRCTFHRGTNQKHLCSI